MHTPGPWTSTEEKFDHHTIFGIHGKDGDWVYNVMWSEGEPFESNMKLMVAAPALLELCKRSFDMLTWQDPKPAMHLKEDLQEFIKKATE